MKRCVRRPAVRRVGRNALATAVGFCTLLVVFPILGGMAFQVPSNTALAAHAALISRSRVNVAPASTSTPTPTLTPGTTLGLTSKGSTLDTGDANTMTGSRVTVGSQNVSVISLSVYVGSVSAAPNNQYQVGIYTDSNGAPSTLVASSSTGTLTPNTWNSRPVSAFLSANTSYWLLYNTSTPSSTANNLFYSAATSNIGTYVNQQFGVWPATASSPTLGPWTYSIYATLGTAVPTNTPVPPSATATATRTSVPPSPTSTSTLPVPSNTPVPPTPTSTPGQGLPTDTPLPLTPTNTSVPPTLTSTPVPTPSDTVTVPTATDTAVATATNTVIPPTATSTLTPTPTASSTTGTGKPILLITSSANAFTSYNSEILTAEGLNDFDTSDVSQVTATSLAAYDVVLLGDMPLTDSQVSMLTNWVTAGGKLIAMHPDKKLAGLLGLTASSFTRSNAYLQVDTSRGPGAGIVGDTIQYHGSADLYTLNGATTIATIFADAVTSTANPAVTTHSVGISGGQAAAFTFDLARSVVLTRQGNPAWAGQNRDGTDQLETPDLFYGNASFDKEPDWNNLDKASIPIADEQQRLLANMITEMDQNRKPLPRFWYFPRGVKAVVIMTGDDHANGGTAGRFDAYIADSPAGCSVANWECIRSSSYVYTSCCLTNSQAVSYTTKGFEVALHVSTTNTWSTCATWGTPAALDTLYANELQGFRSKFTGIPTPSSNRTHCVEWDDYMTQPKVELKYGIRLDTNYYYYPSSFVNDRPGFFNGTGEIMRFADLDGSTVNVYQATTQMTDESGQSYPYTVDTLLSNALGPNGFYGAFTANMHTDSAASSGSDAIIASAQANHVPVVSGRQMLQWLDGRNGSSFGNVNVNGSTLSFSVTAGSGANGLQAMLPVQSGIGVLTTISNGSVAVPFTTQIIKGINYAFFTATSGSYTAAYAPDTTPPSVSGTSPVNGSTNVGTGTTVTATFNEALDSQTVSSSTFTLRDQSNNVVSATVSYAAATNTAKLVPLSPLAPGATYTATIKGGGSDPRIKDISGNALAVDYVFSFTTGTPPPAGTKLGYTSIGSQVDTGDANDLTGSRFTTGTHPGSISSMSVYIRSVSASPNNKYQLAVYTDNAGAPGSLVASSATGTLTANSWNTLPISVALEANTAYWLVYNTSSTASNLSFIGGSAGQGAYSNSTVPFGSWPTLFGSPTIEDVEFSIYATY